MGYIASRAFKYADDGLPYTGPYIQIKGSYYAGKSFVVRKSREIIPVLTQTNDDSGIYQYAMIHKDFIELVKQPTLELVRHPRTDLSPQPVVIQVYVIQRKRDKQLYEVTEGCYKALSSPPHPLYKFFNMSILVNGEPYQQMIYNRKTLFSVTSYNVIEFVKQAYKI